MLQLHIANKVYSSWSLRPWVLMRTLGIPFEEQLTPFGTGSNWDAYRAFSPTGKVPCLHTDAGPVWESIAIAEYLAEHHPSVWPDSAPARTWARCASAEMHAGFSALRTQCAMNCAIRVRLHQIDTALQKDLDRLQELWTQGLQQFGGPYLAGPRFTAVDAFFCPVALRVQTYGLPLTSHCQAYADRLLALPAMQDWIRDALAETWIEPNHETACLQWGTLVSDLRAPG